MGIVSGDSRDPVSPAQWAELRDSYPDAQRLWWSLLLARDPDTWAALAAGDTVDPERLDQAQLCWARKQRLVRLDFTIADELGVAA